MSLLLVTSSTIDLFSFWSVCLLVKFTETGEAEGVLCAAYLYLVLKLRQVVVKMARL